MPKITNVVAIADLNTILDLKRIEEHLPMAQYIPQKFSGLLLRILSPYKAHCQLYQNGKITVNGARSEPDARELVQRFAKILASVGFTCTVTNYRVVNIVGNHAFPNRLHIEKFKAVREIQEMIDEFNKSLL
ncbi:TATA-box-binding protein-like [Paramacrobiotus metropolitanus]|uniref:TATA-box-binding protein-like n=1 Tax=Paramacrobiotus metropolitanus TaxID=2943436 RepID=UPI0024458A6D|nr:TATA-box-binding protein-like [Paramacrobiotus metropolitanus]